MLQLHVCKRFTGVYVWVRVGVHVCVCVCVCVRACKCVYVLHFCEVHIVVTYA